MAASDARAEKDNAYELLNTQEVGAEVSRQPEVEEQSPSSQVEQTTCGITSDPRSEGVSLQTVPGGTPEDEMFVGAEEDAVHRRAVKAFNDEDGVKDSANTKNADASTVHTAKLPETDDKIIHSWRGHVQPESENVAEFVTNVDATVSGKLQLPVKGLINIKSDFYRATRVHSADYEVQRCLSVCPSVRPTPVFCLNGYIHTYMYLTTKGRLASDMLQ